MAVPTVFDLEPHQVERLYYEVAEAMKEAEGRYTLRYDKGSCIAVAIEYAGLLLIANPFGRPLVGKEVKALDSGNYEIVEKKKELRKLFKKVDDLIFEGEVVESE